MASKTNPAGGSGTVGSPAPNPNPAGGKGTVGGPAPKPAPPAAGIGIGAMPINVNPPRHQTGPVGGESGPTRGGPVAAPTPGTGTTGTAPTGGTTDMGPEAELITTLTNFGLGDLASWAWNEHISGKNDTQIMLDMRQTDTYKQRFPGMAALSSQGQAITEQEYIAKEIQDKELIHAAGLDPNKYASRQALGNLIANGVSSTELQNRLNLVQSAVMQAPPEARQYLQDNFGITNGDLADYFLDPNGALPGLQMKAQAASIGGAAAQTGFGYLDVAKAMQLAGVGVTTSQAQAGFGKIAQEGELTHTLGDGTGSLTNTDLIDAQLGGNGNAAAKLQKVASGRVANFQGGGTFAANQSGVSGLGKSDQGFG